MVVVGQREIRLGLKEARRSQENLIRQVAHRDEERGVSSGFFVLSRRTFETVTRPLGFPGKRPFSFRFPSEPITSARVAVRNAIGN